MALKSLVLWMLLLWIQEGVSAGGNMFCGNYTSTLGKAVELKCCYSGNDLESHPFRVQWQLKGFDCLVAAYFPDRIASPQCERYKDRTELKEHFLLLQLLNVSLEDSKIYECILQKNESKGFQKIFQGWIRLEVAAYESLNTTSLPSPTHKPTTQDNQQQAGVIAISFLAVAVVIIIILILFKRRRSLYRAYNAPVGMEMS